MSASPGAYFTSIPQQIWISVGKNRVFWWVNSTYTANASYTVVPPYHVFGESNQFSIEVAITVTAVSGTSPTLTVSVTRAPLMEYINGAGLFASWIQPANAVSTSGIYISNATFYGMYAFQILVSVGGTSPSFTAYIEVTVSG